MKLQIAIVLLAVMSAQAQGKFQNLDFEPAEPSKVI
jgi:hypothetical protein